MRNLIVLDNPKEWEFRLGGVELVPARTYLTDSQFAGMRDVRLFNFCRSFRYQSMGYYVSLLAQARGHKVIPDIGAVQDIRSLKIPRLLTDDIDELVQKSLRPLKGDRFTLSIYFGRSVALRYARLASALHHLFQAPLLRANFVRQKTWYLQHIAIVPHQEVPEFHREYVERFGREYFSRQRFGGGRRSRNRYDLALLVNGKEKHPPSNRKAMQKFMKAAEEAGFEPELVGKEDYNRLAEFDALFIRETTGVNHYTYDFSRRASASGLVVIDDPASILRCTNKVFLAELLARAKLPMPATVIIHRGNKGELSGRLKFPCVLKAPDGSFSIGVVKAENEQQLEDALDALLERSDFVIGQEYLPSEFDWRIGVFDNRPIFACKYYMAKGHWQIYNWKSDTVAGQEGGFETLPLDKTPEAVLKTALRAARLIGDGLYGVDLKEVDGRPCVVEINDNPNLDHGIEDQVAGDALYRSIMGTMMERLRRAREAQRAGS